MVPHLSRGWKWKSHQTMPKPHRKYKAPLESSHPTKSPSQLTASSSEKDTATFHQRSRKFWFVSRQIPRLSERGVEFYWSSPAGYFGRSKAHGNVFTVMYPSFLKASLNAWKQTNSSSLGYFAVGKKVLSWPAPQGPITEEINGLDFFKTERKKGKNCCFSWLAGIWPNSRPERFGCCMRIFWFCLI